MNYPRLFAVVSWGAAATHWLTRVLNAHPNTLCFHHLVSNLRNFGDFHLSPVEYMTLVANAGAGYKLAGDVHGIELESIPELEKRWPDRFRFAIVIRHPVLRVRSSFALWDNKLGIEKWFEVRKLNIRETLAAENETAPERYLFGSFVKLTNKVCKELDYSKPFLAENLTTSLDEINRLLSFLSDGELQFNSPEGLFEEGPSHAKKVADPEQCFNDFTSWQKEMFAELLTKESRKNYEHLGYDMSFVK